VTLLANALAQPDAFHALLERKECSQLFVLYSGMAGKMMMNPLAFLKETRLLERNILIIRDLRQSVYQLGVSPEYPDIPSLMEWQRQRIAALSHVRHVYCLGSSGGAYMALLSGHALKAEAVWAFAPPVVLRPEPPLDHVDARFADLATILHEFNGVTRYRVYYNEAHTPDRLACSKLATAPGVQLFPQGGEGHGVLQHMLKTNRLQGLMPPKELT
jgi:hypothetical protein